MTGRASLRVLAAALATLAALALPSSAGAGGKCSCRDLRALLAGAERSRDAYESIFQDEVPIRDEKTLNRTWCDRMGLENCTSLGKPGPPGEAGRGGKPPADAPDAGGDGDAGGKETPAQKARREANERCKRTYCDWYCDVALDTVHEAFHDWYSGLVRSPIFTIRVLVSGMGDQEFIWSEMAREEAAAWQATAKYLADKVAEAEGAGTCDDVRGSPKPEELVERWTQARQQVDDYLAHETGRGAADAGTPRDSGTPPEAGTPERGAPDAGGNPDAGTNLPGGMGR